MTLLGQYQNGNYQVKIFNDGTKVRLTKENEFVAEFPESMDVKITNYCDMGCEYCHENSNTSGKHAELVTNGQFAQAWMNELKPYTEMAIGGGNPLSHPELDQFLHLLSDRNVLANLTVNYNHFKHDWQRLDNLDIKYLVRGIGISVSSDTLINYYHIRRFPNAVLHLIAGLDSIEFVRSIPKDMKVLFLGYKTFGRGINYLKQNAEIHQNIQDLAKELPSLGFKVMSLDNLAIEQLKPQEWLSDVEWQERYMGDDGTHTMYIDAVKKQYAVSSTSQIRYPINSLKDAFKHVKEVRYVN